MSENFLAGNPSDRIRIIKADKDPIHIYELFQKHFSLPIEILKDSYKIIVDVIKSRIFIQGSEEKLYNLFLYLEKMGVQFESIEPVQLRIDLDHFLNKII
jgi:hypothetical protein